jgi:plasmid stabilization system protein ParE
MEDAARWYERQNEGLGDEFLDEVLETFDAISGSPYLHAVVHRKTRRALTNRFPFAIYYRIEEYSVVVLAVMHGSRHPKRWKERT